MADTIVSRREEIVVHSLDAARTYRIAPLTFRERAALYADLAREGARGVSSAQRTQALRDALSELAPDNLPDLLAAVDLATTGDVDPASEEGKALAAQIAVLERAALAVPAFADLVAAAELRLALIPALTLRRALRGWHGEGLPGFRSIKGAVPDELLEAMPPDDLDLVGWRAWTAAHVGAVAEKNSAAPSPCPATPSSTGEG